MADYTLQYPGATIDSLLGLVNSPDANPTASSDNLVKSGGVKSYVDGITGSLSSLTTTAKTSLVDAINEVAGGIHPISTSVQTDKTSTTKASCPKSVYDEVHPAVGSSEPSGGMLPNVFYNLGTLSGDTTFSFASASDNAIKNEWMFQFTTPSTAPTITWPNAITAWAGGSTPTINASKTYQVSVVNGLGVIGEF